MGWGEERGERGGEGKEVGRGLGRGERGGEERGLRGGKGEGRPLAHSLMCIHTYLHGSCASILLADDISIVPPHLLVGDESGPTQLLVKREHA